MKDKNLPFSRSHNEEKTFRFISWEIYLLDGLNFFSFSYVCRYLLCLNYYNKVFIHKTIMHFHILKRYNLFFNCHVHTKIFPESLNKIYNLKIRKDFSENFCYITETPNMLFILWLTSNAELFTQINH